MPGVSPKNKTAQKIITRIVGVNKRNEMAKKVAKKWGLIYKAFGFCEGYLATKKGRGFLFLNHNNDDIRNISDNA